MSFQNEFLFSDPFTATYWKEAVDAFSPSQLAIGPKRSSCTLIGYVDWARFKNAVLFLAGYAYVDETNRLRRNVPSRHPIYPGLYCTDITNITGVIFDGKQEIESEDQDLPYAEYTHAKITASYSQLDYWAAADWDDYGTEDWRWTTFTPEPFVENLVLPAGEVTFIAPGKAWDGRPVPAFGTIIRARKNKYTLTHYGVPAEYVRDDEGATPKLDAAIGCLNSDVYSGKPPGCWLLDRVGIEIYGDPIAADVLNTRGRQLNVKYEMIHFDPPRGHSAHADRGWLLEPAVDGLWYPVQRPAGAAAKYTSIPFAKLFTHREDAF
jgi:hypothetical protein